MSKIHDPERVNEQTNKAEIPEKIRRILEEEGVLKAPVLPSPTMPKIDVLARAGRAEGLGFELKWPEPDEEADPEDQVATAIFNEGPQEYRGEDDHPAVAAAIALAAYFESKPKQMELPAAAAAD